ncbi:MAG: hypothetical protein PHW82_11260 [Bacteroidales bacterium]|jgi:hypothetical protein|nr:hypothetical protein [Bacteroidales bacterium]
MKLFIINNYNQKIYLNLVAKSRSDLLSQIGDEFFTIAGEIYTVWDVCAESDSKSTGAGVVIGGVVGLLGGPLGALIGGAMGAAIGNSQDSLEKEKVEYFNRS